MPPVETLDHSWKGLMMTNPISRRALLHSAAAVPAALTLGRPPAALTPEASRPTRDVAALQQVVKLWGDGQSLTPAEHSHILARILAVREIAADDYSIGGVVDELEGRMARLLKKERAVFLATGTLANHLALRIQTRARSRVLVQEESHIHCDSGDGAQVLSNLNLIPLASANGTFTQEEVASAIRRADSGRVRTGIGVIAIESPIRRRLGRLFDYEEMRRICAFAKSEGIATHLDGARLFMASAYSGIDPAEYASHFDTVYVSMWKYFNAPAGAILAGPHALLDDLFHARRMFGGSLPGAWPLAATALHFLDGFAERFAAGVARGRDLKAALGRIRGLRVEEISNGSNCFMLRVDAGDPVRMRKFLSERGVELSAPSPNFKGFVLVVNETLTRKPVTEMVRAFEEAVRA
jgi:threonine aldolase